MFRAAARTPAVMWVKSAPRMPVFLVVEMTRAALMDRCVLKGCALEAIAGTTVIAVLDNAA